MRSERGGMTILKDEKRNKQWIHNIKEQIAKKMRHVSNNWQIKQ